MADLDFTVNADTRGAQASLSKLEKAINNVTKVADNVQKGLSFKLDTSKAMQSIGQIETKLKSLQTQLAAVSKTQITADTTGAVRNISNIGTAASGAGNALRGLQGIITTAIVASAVTNAIQYADAIKDLSSATGISTNALMGFTTAVQANGGDSAKAGDAILKLVGNINEAATGSRQMEEAFNKVGVSLSDLATMSEQEILGKVLNGLKNVSNASEQVALKTQLLGKSFRSVSVGQLAADYEAAAAASRRYAGAIDAAAATQDKLDVAMNQFQMSLLKILQPLTSAIAAMSTKEVQQFTDSIVYLGLVLGSIWTVLKILGAAAAVYATALANAAAAASAAAAATATVGAAVVATTKAASNFFPVLRLLLIGLAAITTAIELIKPGTLGRFDEWLQDLGKVEKQANKTAETLGRLNIKPNESAGAGRGSYDGFDAGAAAAAAGTAETQRLDAARKALGATFEKEIDTIKKIATEYGRLGQQNAIRYQQETALIGLSDQAKNAAQMSADIQNRATEEKIKLEDQLIKLRASGLDSDKIRAKEVEAALKALTAEEAKQLASVNALTSARERATAADKINLFTSQSMLDSKRKLADIENEIAKVGLPELKKATIDIEYASRRAADAAIAEEEARRKQNLSPDEKKKYYDAARQGIEAQVAAQERLNAAQEKFNQQQAITEFQSKSLSDSQAKIRDIQKDMAQSTMTDIEKRYDNINRAAKESAIQAIETENARRKAAGVAKMTAAEEQKYYDAATKNAQDQTKATELQVKKSREFSTGWQRAYKQYVEDAGDASKTAENLFKKATDGMEDAIVGFAKTGKFEWRGFVSSLAEELLRSEVKSLFADLMNWMTGKTTETTSVLGKLFNGVMGAGGQQGAGGGQSQQAGGSNPIGDILGGIGKVFGSNTGGGILETIGSGIKDIFGGFFANGGSLAAGKVGIVGERGPEMISGPANITPIQPTNVIYNINAVDAPSFKAMIAQDPSFIYAVTMQGAKGIPGGR